MYRHIFTFSHPEKARIFAELEQDAARIIERHSPREVRILTYKPMDGYWQSHYRSMQDGPPFTHGVISISFNQYVPNEQIAEYYDAGMDKYINTPQYKPDF